MYRESPQQRELRESEERWQARHRQGTELAQQRRRQQDQLYGDLSETVARAEAAEAERRAAQVKEDAARREQAESQLKERAWSSYPGSRASFEADWPAMRPAYMVEHSAPADPAAQILQRYVEPKAGRG